MSASFPEIARRGALRAAASIACLWLAGCSVLPRPPAQPVRYDFGPVMPAAAAAAAAVPQVPRPAIALAEVEAPGLRDSETSVLYRLAYAESQVVRPYQLARWTLPPAQLVQQRLSSGLGRDRAVLLGGDGTAQPKVEGQTPAVLKVELEEFSHVFRSAQDSVGWVRLRATLVDRQAQGDVLLGQTTFVAQHPAASPDAASGVRALTQATDQVIAELQAWLSQLGH
ncbi:ABC-type transport auxiliary lipoprotein family protein [Comamonas endophytica]|uniref:PqiC family protein n=1 Tax=Comamonas endophytica TaxID=2949090 RepID=A0ABY6GDT1_9BURK|nr:MULTISPECIES: ABC-type transport auxiliary lipoprotein family protein [unclassified Acidovorax]MCD2512607.1 PqiC family protein [Acidovorax sp. D4N7]UYG53033.1 PqiC family protein [Acidovorax sp. 5MLIR]